MKKNIVALLTAAAVSVALLVSQAVMPMPVGAETIAETAAAGSTETAESADETVSSEKTKTNAAVADVNDAEDSDEEDPDEEDPVEENLVEEDLDGDGDEDVQRVEDVIETSSGEDLTDYDSDALFEQYVNKQFSVSSGSTTGPRHAPRQNRLSGQDLVIYNELKPEIVKLADGERSNAEIRVPVSDLLDKTSYTREEMEAETGSADSDTLVAAVWAKLDYSKETIVHSLMNDMPYDLYWFDKASGYSSQKSGLYTSTRNDQVISYSFSSDAAVTFRFYVSADFSKTGATKTYDTDTSKTSAASTAAANAKSIAAEADGKSDYDTLTFYKEKICDLTSYNTEAAKNSSTNYGNPWQLIYVFDNDPDTTVVCEGYAKAFKYLCDLHTFQDSSLDVYTVTGTMTSTGSSGRHMWNVVQESGGNFLVDVTNSDTGTIGQDGSLFMATASSYLTDSSTGDVIGYVAGTYSIRYTYDETTLGQYDLSEIRVTSTEELNNTTQLLGYSAGLSGEVEFRFILQLAKDLQGNAYVQFTLPDGTVQSASSADASTTDVNGVTGYIFTCSLPAKEMADSVQAQLCASDGTVVDTYSMSVKAYGDAILGSDSYSSEAQALARAMLNYGTAAQNYFGYNTDNPASSDLSALDSVSADTLNGYDNSSSDDNEDESEVMYLGSSLVLNSETGVRVYFRQSEGIDAGAVDVATGQALTVHGGTEAGSAGTVNNAVSGNSSAAAGTLSYVEIDGIPAKDLGEQRTIQLTWTSGGTEKSCTIHVNPMNYCYKVLNGSGNSSASLQQMAKALYLFYQAAQAYSSSSSSAG